MQNPLLRETCAKEDPREMSDMKYEDRMKKDLTSDVNHAALKSAYRRAMFRRMFSRCISQEHSKTAYLPRHICTNSITKEWHRSQWRARCGRTEKKRERERDRETETESV